MVYMKDNDYMLRGKGTPLTLLKKLKDNRNCCLYVKWMYVFC